MSPRARSREFAWSLAALLGFVALAGCSSIGDLGRLRPDLVRDDIHDWVGQEAAARAGAPISSGNLTEDERTLRDLAFPLIEPPYDRQRWNAVIYEYGLDRSFRRELWIEDPTVYYAHLAGSFHRSSAARYSQLIDDIRNDIVRIDPFLAIARRVVDLDRRREAAMVHVADITPGEGFDAQARVGENALVIAWVEHALVERCASYRYALEHLAVAEPEPPAADADHVLTQLQQKLAANHLAAPPHFAEATGAMVVRVAPRNK
jgi:hypothetical protein